MFFLPGLTRWWGVSVSCEGSGEAGEGFGVVAEGAGKSYLSLTNLGGQVEIEA